MDNFFATNRSTTRAERLTPERFDRGEMMRVSRKGIRRLSDARRAVIILRLTRLPQDGFLSSSEAAFFLARSRYSITALIRAGRLHALRAKSEGRFPYLYRIPAEQVRAMVEEELGRDGFAFGGEKARRVVADSPDNRAE